MNSQSSSIPATNHSPDFVVNDAWERLLNILPAPPAGHEQIQASVDRMNMGVFRLVVMGEIKKGKSSFINALLGEQDLLPTDSDVATSTVYKLIWGPEHKYKVFFLEGHPAAENIDSPLEIQRDQIADYGTESGNPGNEKGVDFIGIEVPNPMLMDGLVIVDTPGVGGLYKEHKEITWKNAPNADAVFFILDSVESVISQDEIDFLQELVQDITKRVFFIQTKIDIPDAEQWQGWVDRNKDVLCDLLPELSDRLIYMPVSSKLKQIADQRHSGRHLQRSGFIDVIGFLEERLTPAKTEQLARDSAHLIIGPVNDTYRELSSRRQILQAESKDELSKLAGKFKTTQEEFNAWYSGSFEELCHDCRGQLDGLARKLKKDFDLQMDPMGKICSKIIEPLRKNTNLSANEIIEGISAYEQECFHECQLVVNRTAARFQEEATNLVSKSLETLIDCTIGEELDALRESGAADISLDSMHHHPAGYEGQGKGQNIRNAVLAAGTGAGILNLLSFCTGAALVALPGVAFIGAGLAASAVWGFRSKRDREDALKKVASEIQKTIQQAHRLASIEFNDLVGTFSNKVLQSFNGIVQKRKAELKQRLEELEASKSQTSEQRNAELGELNSHLHEVSGIQKTLLAVLGQ